MHPSERRVVITSRGRSRSGSIQNHVQHQCKEHETTQESTCDVAAATAYACAHIYASYEYAGKQAPSNPQDYADVCTSASTRTDPFYFHLDLLNWKAPNKRQSCRARTSYLLFICYLFCYLCICYLFIYLLSCLDMLYLLSLILRILMREQL